MHPFLTASLIGVAAGFFSGMFGIGGGLVMVPAMVLLIGVGQHRAHATSMAAIIVIAAAAVVPFAAGGEVEWAKAGWVLTGSLAGAVIGAKVISRVSAVWLARSFVILALAAAGRLALA